MSALYHRGHLDATQADHGEPTPVRSPQRRPSKPLKRVRAINPAADPAIALDSRVWRGIRYADCYGYFDTIKVLSKRPIPEAGLAMLRAHCKHLDVRYHGEWIRPASGKPYQLNIYPWLFRIELHVPDQAALEYLAKRRGLKLTRADLARDFTFDEEEGKHRMLAICEEHFIQPHQRINARISFDNGGMSTGRRNKGRYLTAYADLACRIDGVVDCFHLEYRHLGTQALARLGLHHPRNLRNFNHAGYWTQIDQEQYRMIDKERLGRHHGNRQSGERRHQSDQTPFHGYRSHDRWLGSLLYRIHASDQFGNLSVQSFIKNYGKGPFAINPAFGNLSLYRRVDTET
jgi:hypothetical protein